MQTILFGKKTVKGRTTYHPQMWRHNPVCSFLEDTLLPIQLFPKIKSQSNHCHINKDSNVVTAKLKH